MTLCPVESGCKYFKVSLCSLLTLKWY